MRRRSCSTLGFSTKIRGMMLLKGSPRRKEKHMEKEYFARRLRVLRAARNWHISEAADRIGIDRNTLSQLEQSLREPHAPTLNKLAKAYNVSVGELFTDAPIKLEDDPKEKRLQVEIPSVDLIVEARDLVETLMRVKGLSQEEASHIALQVESALRKSFYEKVRSGFEGEND
jgi:transcriptional regulator with XRE-family HTH domain